MKLSTTIEVQATIRVKVEGFWNEDATFGDLYKHAQHKAQRDLEALISTRPDFSLGEINTIVMKTTESKSK